MTSGFEDNRSVSDFLPPSALTGYLLHIWPAILERDEEGGRRRILCDTSRTSDEVAAQKRRAPSGRPNSGRLLRCSSVTMQGGIAPSSRLESGSDLGLQMYKKYPVKALDFEEKNRISPEQNPGRFHPLGNISFFWTRYSIF